MNLNVPEPYSGSAFAGVADSAYELLVIQDVVVTDSDRAEQ